MTLLATPPLEVPATLPTDEALPGLPQLFDGQRVWRAYCEQFGAPDETPQRIRTQQLRHKPGVGALVSYLVEWQWDRWVVEDQFAIELADGGPERLFRYPEDPYLPGLRQAASALDAHQLLAEHTGISAQRLHVEPVRYRPATRAVLRHIASWRQARTPKLTLYVRVMPTARVARVLSAVELAERSGFAVPRLAGCWAEGGVVWFTALPGDTVRTRVRSGRPPDPGPILDSLAKLWSEPVSSDGGHTLNLLGGFQLTQRLLSHLLQGEEARRRLQQLTDVLGPFAHEWRPSTLAHNDFYDDQVLVTPEGYLALADFEEIGPGDPLLDVGNMLAHLSWMARFGISPGACYSYRRRVRSAAIDRFGWDTRDLALREAFAIFRLSANPLRRLRRNWPLEVETGLRLATDVLEARL